MMSDSRRTTDSRRNMTLDSHTGSRSPGWFRVGRRRRPPQFRTQRSRADIDVELQQPETDKDDQAYSYRARLAALLFGQQCLNPGAPVPALSYLNFLEKQIQGDGRDRLHQLLLVLKGGGAQISFDSDSCLLVVIHIAKIIKGDPRSEKSIHDILKDLLKCYSKSETDVNDATRTGCWQAIYLILSWLTMTFQASLHAQLDDFPMPLPACCAGTRKCQRVEGARRPFVNLLRAYVQLLPSTPGKNQEKEKTSALIHVSSLNFDGLRRFGRIHIEWTDTLSTHLRFHESTKTLHLFRFPSFCALTLLNGTDSSVLYRVLHDHFHDHDSSSSLLGPYLQEILLSYRLLFGQDRQSRKHFAIREKTRVGIGSLSDPFLATLCGQKNGKRLLTLASSLWPKTCLNFEDQLQEQGVYDAKLDFPFLGDRLLRIQAFSMRQQPNRIRDLWRDRRRPLQWYTFWLVLLVGGLAVILALLQCFISAAQLYYAINPRQPVSA